MKKLLLLSTTLIMIISISLISGISDIKTYDYSRCSRTCNEYKKIDQKSCTNNYISKLNLSRIDYKLCLKNKKSLKDCLNIFNSNNKQLSINKKSCNIQVADNFFNCKDNCLNSGSICSKEGETVPVIMNPPSCCENLSLISPKEEFLAGISGICTSKCGNNICDNKIESIYNCPEDCNKTESSTICVQCGEECMSNTSNIFCLMYINPDFECKIINNICVKVSKNINI